MTDAGPRYHRSPHVLWRRTLDTVVVLPVSSDEEPFALAGSGPEVWGLLAEPRRVDEIVDRLAEIHGVTREVVGGDLEPLLERLLALGAIERY